MTLSQLGDEDSAAFVHAAVDVHHAAALVPRALAPFRGAHPDVELSLVEGLTPALLERLAAGDADVAVVSSSPTAPIDSSRFDLHHLLDERLLVAVSREHRLARRHTVRLAELTDDPFIVGSTTAEESLLRASLPSGFQPRVDIVAADWTGKLGCVAAGLGVALVPALAARVTPADIALLRLRDEDETVRRVFAATAAARAKSPAVSQFVTYLDHEARRFAHDVGQPRTRPRGRLGSQRPDSAVMDSSHRGGAP